MTAARVIRRPSTAGWFEEQTSKLDGDLFDQQDTTSVVVGIDASLTNFGISVLDPVSLRHVTVLFKPKLKGAARLNEIYSFVGKAVRRIDDLRGIEHITLENYAMGIRGGRTFSIGEGGGAVKLALIHELGVDEQIAYPTLVTPGQVKKFTTSRGDAKKNEMLLGVYRKWGAEFSSDDQADSYALSRVAAAVASGQTEFEYEAAVVAQLERHTEWLKP